MLPETKSIQVQAQLSADDYTRYFAVVAKRQSTWVYSAIYSAAFCLAIPAAFAARALVASEDADSFAIELVGRVGLLAFIAGFFACMLAAAIVRRRAMAGLIASTPHAFDAKIVTLDDAGVSIKGKLSEMGWIWPAITHVTAEKDLVLLWIAPQSAVIIPDRAFADADALNSAIAFARDRIAQTRIVS